MAELTSRRPIYARLLDRAVRIPAMRDHNEQELRCKLAAPIMGKDSPEKIDVTAKGYGRIITWYHEHSYLDDSRFVAHFIASHSHKGCGPARIRQGLSQKGISREATGEAMCECDIDWCTLAHDQATRKYGGPLPTIFSEKVKVQRFLFYRGYLMGGIRDI